MRVRSTRDWRVQICHRCQSGRRQGKSFGSESRGWVIDDLDLHRATFSTSFLFVFFLLFFPVYIVILAFHRRFSITEIPVFHFYSLHSVSEFKCFSTHYSHTGRPPPKDMFYRFKPCEGRNSLIEAMIYVPSGQPLTHAHANPTATCLHLSTPHSATLPGSLRVQGLQVPKCCAVQAESPTLVARISSRVYTCMNQALDIYCL